MIRKKGVDPAEIAVRVMKNNGLSVNETVNKKGHNTIVIVGNNISIKPVKKSGVVPKIRVKRGLKAHFGNQAVKYKRQKQDAFIVSQKSISIKEGNDIIVSES